MIIYRTHNTTIGLADVGITRDQSSRYQAIASIPIKTFNEHLETSKQLSSGALVQIAKQQQLDKQRYGPRAGQNIITGDASVLFDRLDDSSVSLILTDPPYHQDDLHLFESLAKLAAAKLAPGGLCLAYSGTVFLPQIMELMSKHLRYWWLFAIRCSGQTRLIQSRSVKQCYQSVIAFCRPPVQRKQPVIDLLSGGNREKDFHKWQTPVSESEYFISKLTDPGDLVVDPYCGSGTTLIAAKKLNRQFIGTEIDSGTAKMARRRIAA